MDAPHVDELMHRVETLQSAKRRWQLLALAGLIALALLLIVGGAVMVGTLLLMPGRSARMMMEMERETEMALQQAESARREAEEARRRAETNAAGPDIVQRIALGALVSTNGQKGLQAAPAGAELQALQMQRPGGASNVFLVRGQDIADALKATHAVQVRGLPADAPVPPTENSRPARCWLTVYFGTAGSQPSAWQIHSVERRDHAIRVAYSRHPSESNDEHAYFLWVPLGELEPARYTLELFDVNTDEVTLARRVRVEGP